MKKTINTMEELLKGLDLKDENQIDWFNVSRNRKLSENFIEKYKNKVNCPSLKQDKSFNFFDYEFQID